MRERWPRRFHGCFMSGNPHLNGCDYLMLGFDYELRRRVVAGNSCEIKMELKWPVPVATLQEQLRAVTERYPVLTPTPGGTFLPQWKLPARAREPQVRVHRYESARCPA